MIRTQIVGVEDVQADHLTSVHEKGKKFPYLPLLFLKKWANPGLFFVYFRSFQTNITIFTAYTCKKMSIQYTVPGFEPTTFGT